MSTYNAEQILQSLSPKEVVNYLQCVNTEVWGGRGHLCSESTHRLLTERLYLNKKDIVMYTLCWSRTPQGSGYWQSIYERLRREDM